MNFKYDFADGNTRFFYYSQPGENVDTKTWGILRQGKLNQFLLPISARKEDDYYVFTYDIAGTINMMAWMSNATPEEQNRTQQRLKYVLNLMADMGIPKSEIVSEMQYIYVDMQTEEIKLVCIPLQASKFRNKPETEGPLVPPEPDRDFIDDIEDREEPRKKKKKLTGFLHRKEENEDMPSIPDPIQPDIREDWEPEEQKFDLDLEFDESSMSDPIEDFEQDIRPDFKQEQTDEFNSRQMPEFQKESKTTNYDFDLDLPEKEFNNYDADDTNYDDGEENTVLLRDDGNEATVLLKVRRKPDAVLIRIQTKEEFRITTEICKIGKRALMTDICIRNNPTISREHCAIYFEEGEYYLEDKGSSNYTYLNGNRVMPGKKELLEDGDEIRMSDEEFIFRCGEQK